LLEKVVVWFFVWGFVLDGGGVDFISTVLIKLFEVELGDWVVGIDGPVAVISFLGVPNFLLSTIK
jgi:hypothetical protein